MEGADGDVDSDDENERAAAKAAKPGRDSDDEDSGDQFEGGVVTSGMASVVVDTALWALTSLVLVAMIRAFCVLCPPCVIRGHLPISHLLFFFELLLLSSL